MLATWDCWKDCVRKYCGSAWSKIIAQQIFVPPSALSLPPLYGSAYTEKIKRRPPMGNVVQARPQNHGMN